jgi:hypothetical protein
MLTHAGIGLGELSADGDVLYSADTIERAAETELGFYGSVFHFTPAGLIDPVEIENQT